MQYFDRRIMTETTQYIKWFSRLSFIFLVSVMAYVVVQPSYNFAHWIPHAFLYDLGIPYPTVLFFEQNADKLLHPLGAFLITVLLIKSELSIFTSRNHIIIGIIISTVIAAEIIQYYIGRGFDVYDLILGIIGSVSAYLLNKVCWIRNKSNTHTK